MTLKTILHLAAIGVTMLVAASAEAVVRTSGRSMNVFELSLNFATPVGKYEEIGPIEFRDFDNRRRELNADEVFDNSWGFGLSYGRVVSSRGFVSFGFNYTNIQVEDSFVVDNPNGTVTYMWVPETPSVNQYDLTLDFNVYLLQNSQAAFAPYVGLGLKAGVTSFSNEGYDSENETNIGVNLNFGADIVLGGQRSRDGYFALSSINSWDMIGTNDRPRFLHIGGGVKYFFGVRR